MFPQSPTAVNLHCINYQSLSASVISHDAAKLFNPAIQLAISELEFQDPREIIFRDRPGSIHLSKAVCPKRQ